MGQCIAPQGVSKYIALLYPARIRGNIKSRGCETPTLIFASHSIVNVLVPVQRLDPSRFELWVTLIGIDYGYDDNDDDACASLRQFELKNRAMIFHSSCSNLVLHNLRFSTSAPLALSMALAL